VIRKTGNIDVLIQYVIIIHNPTLHLVVRMLGLPQLGRGLRAGY